MIKGKVVEIRLLIGLVKCNLHQIGSKSMYDCTECNTVFPRRRKVFDFYAVWLSHHLGPVEESLWLETIVFKTLGRHFDIFDGAQWFIRVVVQVFELIVLFELEIAIQVQVACRWVERVFLEVFVQVVGLGLREQLVNALAFIQQFHWVFV
jgi:hypothetical protein